MAEDHEDRVKTCPSFLPWQSEVDSKHHAGYDVYYESEDTKTHRIPLNSWILILHLF